jgi:hypothetical protein
MKFGIYTGRMGTFGTASDWLSAIASVGALGVAFAAFVTAQRLGRLEIERERRVLEQGRREQAVCVTAWVAEEIVDNETSLYGVMVHNPSTNVVYDLSVITTSKYASSRLTPLTLTLVPPGTYWTRWQPESKFKWAFPVDASRVTLEIRPISKSRRIAVERLSFRDASDQRWDRHANGILVLTQPA